jgi:flagellar assembly protein FliH
MTASSKPSAKPAASKASAYSRFIPREEIDAVASWSFSSMDSNLAPLDASERDEPNATETANLQATREQAWAEGYARGREAGEQETRAAMAEPMQQAMEANAVRMGELLHSVADQLLASEQKISRQLLELACDIARQVVRQELKVNTRQLRTVIGEALEMIVDDGLPATVRMHPDDLALMKDSLIETLGENAPEFAADVTVTPGGCLIHTPSMAVDATVEKRWARAVGNLGLSVKWENEDISPVSKPEKPDKPDKADDADTEEDADA